MDETIKKMNQRYHTDGFIVTPDVLAKDECESINREVGGWSRRNVGAQGLTLVRGCIVGPEESHYPTTVRDERLLTLVEDIVYPGISIYSAGWC